MLVFIVDKNGKKGHPTRKCGMIRTKLKQGKAKILKKYQDTMIVQLLELEIKDEDTIDCKFILGIDPGYICQSCGAKDTVLRVHHIKERSNGGSNRPDNLVTVCLDCHNKIHTGGIQNPKISGNVKMRDSGVLNSCMPALYEQLKNHKFNVRKTYGSDTKVLRNMYDISKTHRGDAFCCAIRYLDNFESDKLSGNEINFQQFRRHNRSFNNRIEDRKYYFGKKLVAKNRNRRSGQDKKKDISLTEFRQLCKEKDVYIPVRVKSGGHVMKLKHGIKLDKLSNWTFRSTKDKW